MMLMYALEKRGPRFILAFAVAPVRSVTFRAITRSAERLTRPGPVAARSYETLGLDTAGEAENGEAGTTHFIPASSR
jgi:hypothetical protein